MQFTKSSVLISVAKLSDTVVYFEEDDDVNEAVDIDEEIIEEGDAEFVRSCGVGCQSIQDTEVSNSAFSMVNLSLREKVA